MLNFEVICAQNFIFPSLWISNKASFLMIRSSLSSSSYNNIMNYYLKCLCSSDNK